MSDGYVDYWIVGMRQHIVVYMNTLVIRLMQGAFG